MKMKMKMNVASPESSKSAAPSESVLHEGKANLQKGLETVGGKLYLLRNKLVFEPHKLNVQRGGSSIDLSSIHHITLGWTKLFGALPFAPNALKVSVDGGDMYCFTVFDRKVWRDKIIETMAEIN